MRTAKLVMAVLAAAAGVALAADKVKVTILSESMCPDCKNFLRDEVKPAFLVDGIWDIVDFEYLPWGNSFIESPACPADGKYSATSRRCWYSLCSAASAPAEYCTNVTNTVCQHGANECLGDRYESCAINTSPTERAWYNFVLCFGLDHAGKINYARQCALASGYNVTELDMCVAAGNPVADKYQLHDIQETFANGPHNGVPWVRVDGELIESGLLDAICKAYKGTKPAGCANAKPANYIAAERCTNRN